MIRLLVLAILLTPADFGPLAFLKIIEAIFNETIPIALARLAGVWARVFSIIVGVAVDQPGILVTSQQILRLISSNAGMNTEDRYGFTKYCCYRPHL